MCKVYFVSQEKYVKITELKPGMRRINLIVRVIKIGDTKSFKSRYDGSMHTVQEILVGDETGVILASIWDEHVGKLSKDSTYVIKNAFTSVYRQTLRLGVGRRSSIEKSSSDIPADNIKMDNNLSEKKISWTPKRKGRRSNNRRKRK